MNLVNAKVQLLDQFHSYFTQSQSMNGNVVAASQWKPKQSFMANSNNVNDVSEHSFIQGWSVEPPCYVLVCSYQLCSWAISWQSLVAAFAQRRESGLPSLLAGSHKLATCTCVTGKVYFTYLSPLGKKPRKTVLQVVLQPGSEAVLQVQLQRRAGNNMCSRTEWRWFEERWFDYTTVFEENGSTFGWVDMDAASALSAGPSPGCCFVHSFTTTTFSVGL